MMSENAKKRAVPFTLLELPSAGLFLNYTKIHFSTEIEWPMECYLSSTI
jgi:hypothetical protein